MLNTTKESLQCLLKKAIINKYILMLLYNRSYFFYSVPLCPIHEKNTM